MRTLLLLFAAAALGVGQQPAVPQQVSFECTVDGTVVNSITGEPVPRAQVSVAAGGTAAQAISDTTGKWSLTTAPCGRVQIVVSRPGFLPYVYGQQPGRPVNPLSLFQDRPMHDVKIELEPQAVVVGKVTDDLGDPAVNVTVSVMASRVVDGRFEFQQTAGANSNDIGDYRIANLQSGRYIVCAHRNAPASTFILASPANMTTLADSCYPGPLDGGRSSTMLIEGGREAHVDFTLVHVPAVHVRGVVTGQPAGRGFGITLMRAGSAPGYGVNFPGTVRPDGKFDIPGVQPGSYVLSGNLFENGKRLFARVPVNVGQADVDNLDVPMLEGFSLTAVIGIDSSDDPSRTIPQFGVTLRPTEPGVIVGQAKWSEDHRSIVFSDLVTGDYELVVNPVAPFYVKSGTIGGQDILHSLATLSPGAGQIDIALRDDGGAVEGDVSDDLGNPVSGGIMAIPRAGRPVTGFAGPGGYFKLQNMAPGDYTLYAWDDPALVAWADADWMMAFASRGFAVTITPGQTSQVHLKRITVPNP